MRRAKWPKYSVLFIVLGVTLLTAQMVRSAYHHMGEIDSGIFLHPARRDRVPSQIAKSSTK